MKKRSSLARDTATGLVVKKAAPNAAGVVGEQVFAIEKGDPIVALANLAPLSARESAAFDRTIEIVRHTSRYPGLSSAHAKQLLRLLMSHISEERYAAGWHIDLEFRLWAETLGRPRKGLLPFERAGLKFLSGAAGGWWSFERFFPMKRWLATYADHNRSLKESSGSAKNSSAISHGVERSLPKKRHLSSPKVRT